MTSRAGMMGMGEVGMTVGRVRGEAGGRVFFFSSLAERAITAVPVTALP